MKLICQVKRFMLDAAESRLPEWIFLEAPDNGDCLRGNSQLVNRIPVDSRQYLFILTFDIQKTLAISYFTRNTNIEKKTKKKHNTTDNNARLDKIFGKKNRKTCTGSEPVLPY